METRQVLYTRSPKQSWMAVHEELPWPMNWNTELKLELSVRIYDGFHSSGWSVKFHKCRPSEYRVVEKGGDKAVICRNSSGSPGLMPFTSVLVRVLPL